LRIDYLQAPFVFSHTSATTVSRKHFDRTRGFPPGVKNFQDFYLFTSIALSGPVIYCGIPLSVYRGDVPGQTTSRITFSSKLENRVRYVNEFVAKYLENRNVQLITWLRAFTRNDLWLMLKSAQYENVRFYLSAMDEAAQRNCVGIGRKFYPLKSARFISLLHLALLKGLYMLRGYPRVNMRNGHRTIV
jgi:hypothetical protein